ncbi:MAG: CHAT domain-containing protein, partial [Methylococcales bacterium]
MRIKRTISIILSVIILSDFTTAREVAHDDLLTGVEQTESLQSDRNGHAESDALIKSVKTAEHHFQSGQFDLAREQFEDSIKQARKSGNAQLLASSLINLGNVNSALENYDSAQSNYLESAKIAEQASYHALAVRAYANAARVERLRGINKNAGDLLQSAGRHLHSLTETPEKVELQLGLGRLLLKQQGEKSDSQTAYQLLDDAAKTAEKLALKDLQAYAYGYLGALYLDNNRLQEALTLTNRAEFLAQSIDRPDILFRWQWQNGRILAKQGAKDAALSAYRRAVATLQPIRSAQRAQRAALAATDNVDDLFIEWADLLLQKGNLTELDLLEIRNIVEQGKIAELENYYHDDCVAAWLNKASKIDQLAARTAALYPILFPDRLELLLSLPKGLQRYTVRQNREEVRQLVDRLRVTLENRATPEFLPYAEALYHVLIEPVLADLTQHRIDTLVFVPDASFRTIPLAALHDGNDFLIRRFAVATSPGLTLTDP